MSAPFRLSRADGTKILKGLLVAVLGAALTYLTDLIPNVDLGPWTPAVTAGWSVVVNFLRKWMLSSK